MKSSRASGWFLGLPVGDEDLVGPFLLLDQDLLGAS
jgi:hypothetical protein